MGNKEETEQSSTIEIMQASSLTKVNSGLNGALKRSSVGVSHRRRLVISNAKAGNWYPGAASPKWLDGSLPGDYGFDPLKLGTEPEQLKWFAQAELLHARFAMLGCLGILAPEAASKLGVDWPGANVDWVEAATFQYDADSKVYFVIQLFLMHWIKIGRLAMMSFLGFWLQYNVQGKGPIACWGDHLANPFVNNILSTKAIPFIDA